MHALVAAVLLRMPGLMRSMAMPRRSHQTEIGEIEQGIGTGEGDAVVGTQGKRQPALGEQPFEGGEGQLLAG